MIRLNIKRNNGGFTLLEALVATSILMVAVAAPITIAQKGLSSAVYSKNQMIASYLAQDAIEYIKNRRDQNIINGNFESNGKYWLKDLESCIDPVVCRIDTNANAGSGDIQPYIDGDLLKKDGNGFYGFTGSPTSFSRKINIITPLGSPSIDTQANGALVTVTVSWATDSVVVKTLIFNI